uniref:Uncharacterized protein n=1 Tax=Arundo donax TaxID=35708 RepID=A0A0A8ZY93_ARUDO
MCQEESFLIKHNFSLLYQIYANGFVKQISHAACVAQMNIPPTKAIVHM